MYEKVEDSYELFYRYDNDGKLSMIVKYLFSNNTNYYYTVVTNTQGDVVALLNGSGVNIVNYTYDSWGNLVSVKNASGTDITSSSNIAYLNSIRYRGYVYDNETGLYYLQSRYYDPETGRFINCDDVDYIGYEDSFVGWNGFAYCGNDAVNQADPTGNSTITDDIYTIVKRSYDGKYGFMGLGFYNTGANNFVDFFDKTWSTKKYCSQRIAGYNDIYDYSAWMMGCYIHCLKSEFYYGDRWWRIELWMGRYGVSVGGEIGVYSKNSLQKPYFYDASRNYELKMEFTLYEYDSIPMLLFDKNNMSKLFFISTNSKTNSNGKHWWLTGFKYNINVAKHKPYSKNLFMQARITFPSYAMGLAFKNSLKSTGLTKTSFSAILISNKPNNTIVEVKWSSRYKK